MENNTEKMSEEDKQIKKEYITKYKKNLIMR